MEAEPRMSGTILHDQLKLMWDLHGEELVGEAIESLPRALRDEVGGILPGSWVTTDAARELKAAVAERLGEEVLDFQRRIVAKGIERTFNTVWRFFLRQIG